MEKIKSFLVALVCLAASATLTAQSPYMTRVFEFTPAPSQFIHVYPAVTLGMDEAAVANLAEIELAGREDSWVTLGAFGGYIVVGFDHDIQNEAGQKDFQVLGNSFYSTYATYGEPGIVMVADDVNGNGLPDDPWYEIAGSAYASCVKNYSLTYYKPADSLDNATGIIDEYIRWRDNQGNTGYMPKNGYHSQSYYPCWYGDSCTFTGTFIPNDILSQCNYGYCDAVPNQDANSGIDISDAVNADGTPANLQKIRFIKVYTGTYKVENPFGENSTEFCGAKDLHATVGIQNNTVEEFSLISNTNNQLLFNAPEEGQGMLYSLDGQRIAAYTINHGFNALNLESISDGIYVLAMQGRNKTYRLKVIKR